MSRRRGEAESIEVGVCSSCENIHVVLRDERDRVIAVAYVPPAEWAAIVREVATGQAVIRSDDSIGKPQGHA